jgi:glycosyltransferase involved in cell wall biosynthesis
VNRTAVLLLGPHRAAASAAATHVQLLLDSGLGDDFELLHFPTGSEGRGESFAVRWLRLAASPFWLFATILFRQVAVVHLNTSLHGRTYWRDLAYVAVAKLLRARVVYQVHGGKLPHECFDSATLTRLLRWTLRLPDVVVVLARVELEAYRIFVPGQQVVALPKGIDCRPFAQVPTVRSRAGYPLRLVYMGRLAREKGLYETLQGVRLAAELGIDARIVIAGEGAELDRLRRYAAALNIAPRTVFLPPVHGAAKVKLLAAADVVVLPSYAEGLPYALLEAMAAGIPVIATPVGAIPDVMSHGTHGFFVPPRDGKAIAEALAKLSGDREQLSWMSRACRRRARAAYSIDRLAAELGVQYAALCGGTAAAGRA